jgi:hypothetical protein
MKYYTPRTSRSEILTAGLREIRVKNWRRIKTNRYRFRNQHTGSIYGKSTK